MNLPNDHAGLILIGGMSWFTPEARLHIPKLGFTIFANIVAQFVIRTYILLLH